MPGPNAKQPLLFEMTEPTGREEAPRAAREMPARSSGPELTCSSAGESRRKESGPFQAVSPVANLPLREICAFCGAEVHAPGYVIQDYEELGVFCDEECGDKQFRLYLNDTAEDGVLNEDEDQSST